MNSINTFFKYWLNKACALRTANCALFSANLLSFPKKTILFSIFYLLISFQSLSAQVFPVQVNPQLVPPYSLKLSEYETTSSEKLFVNILLTDATELGRQVRLKMFIEGQGLNIQTNDVVAGATPIFLDGGINLRLSNIDLRPYFNINNLLGISQQQYNQALPDGLYNFCFQVFDFISGQQISRKTCVPVFLVLNDPPVLNVPNRGDLVTAQNPQNILFNWTPRHLNATGVQYEFTLKEIWDTGMNPQAAFLASPPLYQETTFATTLLYGPANIQLLEGKTYGWQVRALVSDGISETSVFRNNGLSEIYHFKYEGNCDAPKFVISEAQNSQTVDILWQPSEHLRYEIQYRKEGYGDKDWFTAIAYSDKFTIRNLEPGTTYEFRVGGECTLNGGFAFSQINEFTTPTDDEEAYYNCGIKPELEIANQDPLPSLRANDTFTAGDFPVVPVEVSGSNGNFSGWGYITLPFLEKIKKVVDDGEVNIGKYTRIKVVFNGISINTDYQLISGAVETEYDPDWKSIIDTDQVWDNVTDTLFGDDGKQDEVTTNVVITNPDQIKVAENGDVIVTDANGNEVTLNPNLPAVITDGSDPPKKYHVDKDGNVTEMGEEADGGTPNNDNTNGISNSGNVKEISSPDVAVFFSPTGYYATDKLREDVSDNSFSKKYETIPQASGGNYNVLYKALSDKPQPEDEIIATATFNNGKTKDDVVFKTVNGVKVEADWNGNTATLKLKNHAKFEKEEIIAAIKPADSTGKYDIAGKLNVWHLQNYEVNVSVVPIGNTSPSPQLENQLNDFYNRVGVTINLTVEPNINIPETIWDTNGNKTLDIGDSGLLTYYSPEEIAIYKYFEQQANIEEQRYYVFLFDRPISKQGVNGFMPLKSRYGFVFNQNLQATTMAHELGHGIFGLQHYEQAGTADLLMHHEYSGTVKPKTAFTHMDWQTIHAPGLQLYQYFQGSGAGEYKDSALAQKIIQEIRCAYLNNSTSDVGTIKFYLSRESKFRSRVLLANETIDLCIEYNEEEQINLTRSVAPIQGNYDKSGYKWIYKLLDVTPPKNFNYKYNLGGLTIYTLNEDFEDYLIPTQERVESDFNSVWSSINLNDGINTEEFKKLKSIAACATQYLILEDRIKLLTELSKGTIAEPKEDLILDVLQTTPEQDKQNVLASLFTDFSVFENLYDEMDNANFFGPENNKSRFLNTLYELWLNSDFTDDKHSEYTYTDIESPRLIGYDDKGKLLRGFSFRELRFEIDTQNKKINVIKEDPGDLDDQIETIYTYAYHPLQPISLYYIDEDAENTVGLYGSQIPVFFFMGLEDIKDAEARASAWSLTFDTALLITGIGELNALRNLTGAYRVIRGTLLGIEITTSTLDIILNYSTACNGNETYCNKIKRVNFWLQICSLGADIFAQRMLKNSIDDVIDDNNLPNEVKVELNKLIGIGIKSNLLSKLDDFPSIKNWVNGLDEASDVNLINKIDNLTNTSNGSSSLLSKLEDTVVKYPNIKEEMTSNLKLFDHFEGMHNSWYYRIGLARAYKVTSTGSIDLPDNFGEALKDLDMYSGQSIRSAFNGNNAGAFGIALEQKMGDVIDNAWANGITGIKNSDIPTDLKTYYEDIYNQGYTKVLQQVKIKTPQGTNPVPDFFFFKYNELNEALDLNDVIYHDSKISVNSSWSNAQKHIKQVIEDAKANGVKAEFVLGEIKENTKAYQLGLEENQIITIKEMSKVGTDVIDENVDLVRKLYIEN